jgi:hypothetical protein
VKSPCAASNNGGVRRFSLYSRARPAAANTWIGPSRVFCRDHQAYTSATVLSQVRCARRASRPVSVPSCFETTRRRSRTTPTAGGGSYPPLATGTSSVFCVSPGQSTLAANTCSPARRPGSRLSSGESRPRPICRPADGVSGSGLSEGQGRSYVHPSACLPPPPGLKAQIRGYPPAARSPPGLPPDRAERADVRGNPCPNRNPTGSLTPRPAGCSALRPRRSEPARNASNGRSDCPMLSGRQLGSKFPMSSVLCGR